MITPMVREIKKAFPDSYIVTMTQPNTKSILINNPYIDDFITDDLKKDSFMNIVKEIRKHKFDIGLLVLPTPRAAYQMFLAGIKERIGVGRKIFEIITFMKSVSRNNYIPLRHEADYCMDLARKIGVITENIQPEIFVTEEEKKKAENFYGIHRAGENTYKIILHTGSKNSAPNWSENKYFDLLTKIKAKLENANFVIFLTAVEMTEHFLEKVRELNDSRIINVSKEIESLRDLITVISAADLMICSSTGPIHLADALNIRCIGIHCNRNVNSAKHWGVLNGKSVNLEVTKEYCDLNCSQDKKICKFEDGISTEEVLKHITIQ